jgi:hypothetical protein
MRLIFHSEVGFGYINTLLPAKHGIYYACGRINIDDHVGKTISFKVVNNSAAEELPLHIILPNGIFGFDYRKIGHEFIHADK